MIGRKGEREHFVLSSSYSMNILLNIFWKPFNNKYTQLQSSELTPDKGGNTIFDLILGVNASLDEQGIMEIYWNLFKKIKKTYSSQCHGKPRLLRLSSADKS